MKWGIEKPFLHSPRHRKWGSAMARIGKLSAVEVAKAKGPAVLHDGGGVYLRVSASGAKSWVFRFQLDGKRRDMGLGPFPDISLAEARGRATDHRKQRHDGIDPLDAKEAQRQARRLAVAKGRTFRDCAAEFIDKNRAAIVDFMEDTMRIERWYLDPKNHDAVAEIASRITKQPPERFGWLFTKADYYRNPDMRPDLDALQKNVDMTKDLGFVKASFDVKAHSDLSLIQEAAKRLK